MKQILSESSAYSTLEEKAERVAAKAHQFQFRKDCVTPAICHPRNVVSQLREVGIKDQDIICAAWLHDTIEDSYLTAEYIREEFSPRIAGLVQRLTKNGDREQYKEVIKNSNYDVQIIKLADMVDNCSHLNDQILPKDLVKRKVDDCKTLYLSMAEKICPEFYSKLLDEIDGIEGFSKEKWRCDIDYYKTSRSRATEFRR
jgi:(p)ppGpp synthase/HD superfamily hydrolase